MNRPSFSEKKKKASFVAVTHPRVTLANRRLSPVLQGPVFTRSKLRKLRPQRYGKCALFKVF